jgi:hypothetical protein
MTAAGETLSPDELAAVISYIRKEWSNGGSAVGVEEVNDARKKVDDSGQSGQWEVKALEAAGFIIPE